MTELDYSFFAQLVADTPLDRAIISCLKRPIDVDTARCRYWELSDNVRSSLLWEYARKHRIEMVIGDALRQFIPYEEVPLQWLDACKAAQDKTTSILTELDTLASCFDALGVPSIVLENAAIARAVLCEPQCFSFGDLDILIPPEQIRSADQAVRCADFAPLSRRTPDNRLTEGRLSYSRALTTGQTCTVHLQTDLVARRLVNAVLQPDTSPFFARAQIVSDSGTRILDASDFLLQLCIHSSAHSYIRKPGIRLHMDLDWYVRNANIDWLKFSEVVSLSHAATAAWIALAIPKAIFDTPIPSWLLSNLRPPAWKIVFIRRWFSGARLLSFNDQPIRRSNLILFSFALPDRPSDLWQSVFPRPEWMQQRYGRQHAWELPGLYWGRLFRLIRQTQF